MVYTPQYFLQNDHVDIVKIYKKSHILVIVIVLTLISLISNSRQSRRD